MTNASTIGLGTAFSLADARVGRSLIDKHAAITGATGFVGLWGFNDPARYTIVSSKVSVLANWKSGGPTFEQATGARQVATPTVDTYLGRTVGVFPLTGTGAAAYYQLTGGTFDSTAPWSQLSVVRIDEVVDFSQWFGGNDVDPRMCAATIRTAASPVGFCGQYGDAIGISAVNPVMPGRWYRVLLSYDGTSKAVKLRIGSRHAYVVTCPVATSEPVVTALEIGHFFLRFHGAIDIVGHWTVGLLETAQAATLAALDDYLDRRGV